MDNVTFTSRIRTLASAEYQNRIPAATKSNLLAVATMITDYPAAKNEFINVLTNQVVKTIFMDKLYSNPFKFFKKGSLPYGKSIEMVFVDLIKAKNWNERFNSETSDAGSLIGKEPVSNVKVKYISENFRHKYKITISDEQLKGAFRSRDGLSALVNRLVVAPLNSAEFDEYNIMKGLISQINMAEASITGYAALSENEKAKQLTKVIKTYVGKMKFLSDNYNKGGVHTFSMPNELVILVTPETQAMLDVELLASAFHMDKAEVEGRLVLIDEFQKKKASQDKYEEDTDCLAIVMDVNAVQFYESLNVSESFRNPEQLTTNMFFHRWGVAGACEFVNALKIKKGASSS